MGNSIARQALISLEESSKTIENLAVKPLKICKKKIIGQKRKIFKKKQLKLFQL